MYSKTTSIETVRCGGDDWQVIYIFAAPNLAKTDLDEATSRRWLQLNNKPVAVTGKVVKANRRSIGDQVPSSYLFHVVSRSPSSTYLRSRRNLAEKEHNGRLTLYLDDIEIEALNKLKDK
jgi:hypothetical protein